MVLKGLNMEIPAGKTAFIVGDSGCGKSTLSNILLKLYDTCKGSVLIDGFPIETLSSKWLLNNITVVEQQSVLFNTTIKENIELGNSIRGVPAQELQLTNAISFATLQNIIASSSKGIDSIVGPGGSRLSGGQRQRIALARAHVRNTPILILDESLSALEPQSRDSILRHIREWRKGKTTIIITHELSQIRDKDYVYIMNKGKMLDHGLRENLSHCKIFGGQTPLGMDDPCNSALHSPFSDFFQLNSPGSSHGGTPVPGSPTSTSSIVLELSRPAESLDMTSNKYQRNNSNNSSRGRYSVRPLSSFYPSLSVMGPTTEDNKIIVRNLPVPGSPIRKNTVRPFSAPPSPYSPDTAYFVDNELSEVSPSRSTFELGYINPKDTNDLPVPTFATLYRCFKSIKNKPALFFGIFIAVVNGAVNPIFSYAIANIFTSMFSGADADTSNSKWIILAISIALIDSITIYLRTTVLCLVADRWVRDIRIRAFECAMSRDLSWFVNNKIDTGELTTLIVNQTEDIRVIITLFLTVFSTCLSLSLICIIWVFVLGWKLCLVALALIPGSYLSYVVFKFLNTRYEAQCVSIAAKVDEIIHEMVSGIRTLRILGIESYFTKNFQSTSEKYLKIKLKDSLFKGLGFGLSDIFPFVCQAILLWYGMKLVSTGEYTLTQTMLIFTILLFSITSISVLITAIPQMHKPLITVIRLFHFMEFDSNETPESSGAKIKMSLTGSSISFNDVSFGYTVPKESNALDDVDDDYFCDSDDDNVSETNISVTSGNYYMDEKKQFYQQEEFVSSSSNLLDSGHKGAIAVAAVAEQEKRKRLLQQKQKRQQEKEQQKIQQENIFETLWGELSALKRQSKSKLLTKKLAEKASKNRIVEKQVLHDFTTMIPSNSVVAIVGPSGSGKSTLTSLLTKLYLPTSGSITIGGIDIRDIDTTSLRSEVAVVGQMPLQFFRGTIRQNLVFGLQRDVSIDEIRKVCQECSIDEFICSLPEKYNTILGGSTGQVSSGTSNLMSGGQMQRIGLARALLRQPRVLILDECTSGLDPVSTSLILNKLSEYKKRREITIIIITHQQEVASIADIVISIAKGTVVKRDVSRRDLPIICPSSF